MSSQEVKRIKLKVKEFLHSNKPLLEVKYNQNNFTSTLNPSKFYHRTIWRNPFTFLWRYLVSIICFILPSSKLKNLLYRSTGMNIGKDVAISAGALFDLGFPQLISIGDGTMIGTGVKILTHESTFSKIRFGRVIIGKQVLIGTRATIRSGVTIGNQAAIGMSSLVINNVKDREFVAGVPAKRIKMLKKLI